MHLFEVFVFRFSSSQYLVVRKDVRKTIGVKALFIFSRMHGNNLNHERDRRHSEDIDPILFHRLRRWPNIDSTYPPFLG